MSCIARFSSELAGAGRNDMGFGSFNLFSPRDGGPARGVIFVTLFQSFSRGTIRLQSRDPAAHPRIDFDMLSDERDIERMRAGVHRLFELSTQPAVRGIATQLSVGGADSANALPTDLDGWLLANCGTIGHPCASAPMGASDDPATVLDADCRVLGLQSLRVVDASSMPSTPRANNHLSCVMLAEHIAHRMLHP